ncbi:MAG: hypothetical protein ABJF50_08905 [Paracoccaceae bacterium]
MDDDGHGAEVLARLFKEKGYSNATAVRHPSRALALAERYAFDLVLIDVTINYKGNSFGGLEVYRRLLPRYGSAGLLAYSQYIDDHVLERFGEDINFIERGFSRGSWADTLMEEVERLRLLQSCFVAMPFSKDYASTYDAIATAIRSAKYVPVRVDEQVFTESIVDKIFSGIRRSRFVVSLVEDKNPNVYFETGFAAALEKDVVTIATRSTDLPFDLQSKNTLFYDGNLSKLTETLSKNLSELTNQVNV